MTQTNKVALRFKDGRVIKGTTQDFMPGKPIFHIYPAGQDKAAEVKAEDLKAVFFVKTFEGDKVYLEKKRFDEVETAHVKGRKVKIEFFDGEIIRGISAGYSRGRKGFFIIPVDPECNNEKIYVISDALRQVELGSAADK